MIAQTIGSVGRYWLAGLVFWFAPAVSASEAASPETHVEQGLKAFQRGAFEEAVSKWTDAARAYESARRPRDQIEALIQLSQAYSAIGQYKQAVYGLETALRLAQDLRDPARIAAVLAALGNAHIAVGPPETAEDYLRRSLTMARDMRDPALVAVNLNNLGNLLTAQKKYADAKAAYQEGVDLAKRAGQRSLTARALSNAAAAARKSGEPVEARRFLDMARDELRQAAPGHDSAFVLVNIGLGYRDLRASMPDAGDPLLLEASKALTEAGTVAEGIGDRRTASYAWGNLGTLYEDERRYEEALRLTRKAIFLAQQVNAPESLYRWQWQAGRLVMKLGRIDDAISAYRRAVYTLQSIRPELLVGYGASTTSFRESVGPVYFELVDLLLQRAASLPGRDQVAPYLIEARETVELLKVAELRDYFRDDCVDTALSKVATLDVVSQTAVAIYPILLPDRVELLVSLPGELKRVPVPVGAERLTQEVRQFRRKLEKRTTREYLPHAQQLYDWLIRPLEADLASLKVDTLVFVPDGPLRTIPMAALHDGKQFLVSKYALGITPSLNLTDPRPLKRERPKVLAVGVTESVQGFPPLPNVAAELDALRKLFDSTTLVDQDFLVSNLEKKLKGERFTIVHVASHGQFDSDVQKTFLLTFDDKLTMDRLDQLIGVFKYRDDPLELLTLSACETAAGDDRAALGLAGVAIKAGARSAVATLWQVNDEVSADLVADFYRQLRDPSTSRALALQRAQLKVLGDPRYDHPGFWAPFLLINNWL
jgi:CHAT domain-containing protein/Tfp pilus assembly protein PilF